MTKPESQLKPNGRAAAAMLAGMIGLLVLGIVQTGTGHHPISAPPSLT